MRENGQVFWCRGFGKIEMHGIWSVLDPRQHAGMTVFVSQVVVRLLLAAFLGGLIGLERELRHKPAGLRTNIFICFGAALYTILSERLAIEFGGDHTRIAAQIIPGIGFIGAGSILHSKMSVHGLTSAATIFVVASIGMAAGGGLFLPAIFATLVLLGCLVLLGLVEGRFGFKFMDLTYEAEGPSVEPLVGTLNRVLDEQDVSMQSLQIVRVQDHFRVVFSVQGTRHQHNEILRGLRAESNIQHFSTIAAKEQE